MRPSVAPIHRSRSLPVAVALVLFAAAACAPSNAPTGYTDVVKANFIAACTGDIESPSTTLASTGYCECAYQTFVDNVPYNDDDKANRDNGERFRNYEGKTFVDVEADLRNDPNALSDAMKSRLQQCGPGDQPEGTTPEGTTPEGTTPEGTTPEGTTPEGTTPEGTTPAADPATTAAP